MGWELSQGLSVEVREIALIQRSEVYHYLLCEISWCLDKLILCVI